MSVSQMATNLCKKGILIGEIFELIYYKEGGDFNSRLP